MDWDGEYILTLVLYDFYAYQIFFASTIHDHITTLSSNCIFTIRNCPSLFKFFCYLDFRFKQHTMEYYVLTLWN